jgi:hypothetical protein
MDLAMLVYVLDSVIFAGILIYMFTYNARMKRRIKELEAQGRKMHSEEEGIAVVTLERQNHHAEPRPHRI